GFHGGIAHENGNGQPSGHSSNGNEESSARAKHIDIKFKFIKDYTKKGIIKPIYVSTEMMAADLLTKAFSAPWLQVLMKMCSLYRSETNTSKRAVRNTQHREEEVSEEDVFAEARRLGESAESILAEVQELE
ncbi:unnamed protein product, partial [Peronospora destructor]